jgi:hypothetical protein
VNLKTRLGNALADLTPDEWLRLGLIALVVVGGVALGIIPWVVLR